LTGLTSQVLISEYCEEGLQRPGIIIPSSTRRNLAIAFQTPQKERYVRELMGMSGLALCTIQDELRKLRALRLVTSRSDRYHRFYRANRDHSLFQALVQIVENSESNPQIKHSMAHRKRKAQTHLFKKQRPLRPDRPMSWNLFSKSPKTW